VEAVILCGIPSSGKTTLYTERFLTTHLRISRDVLRTPHREARLLDFCLEKRQPFVLDRVNATPDDRGPYVGMARRAGFRTVAWFVDTPAPDAIARNAAREERWQVAFEEILATNNAFVAPMLEEGFDEVWHALPDGNGGFRVDRRAAAEDGSEAERAAEAERFTKRAAAKRATTRP
jgi:predicted kinase